MSPISSPPSAEINPVLASVRGRRGGRQHDAGSMQFRCAHLIVVLRAASNRPDHGIFGIASLGGLEGLRSGRRRWVAPQPQATFSLGPSERRSVPSPHIRCRMTPMRRASATIASFDPRQWTSFAAQVLSKVERPQRIMTVAGRHRARPSLTSPALVIPPEASRSPG